MVESSASIAINRGMNALDDIAWKMWAYGFLAGVYVCAVVVPAVMGWPKRTPTAAPPAPTPAPPARDSGTSAPSCSTRSTAR